MGAWGYGIFESDMAADVKHEFAELLGEGLNDEEATAAIVERYDAFLDDIDVGPEIVFALAAPQKGSALADAVNAVSRGLLDLQVDSMEALRRAVPHRMMYWLMDDDVRRCRENTSTATPTFIRSGEPPIMTAHSDTSAETERQVMHVVSFS